ncbi:MAG: leucine-rich repeat domain-containing protein [Clostridia bacterium]|nr:leucine-rich repeat domain-containing protein [Clostridia bacterium]
MSYLYKMIDDGTYCLTHYEGKNPVVQFPEHITVSILGDKLFKNHVEIEKLQIPETVTQIAGWVFDGCINLKEIILPPQLVDMWQYALTRIAVEKIEIPGSVHQIVPFVFNGCENLKEVVFHEGTEIINAYAFKNCKALEDVYLPVSIKNVHEKAFEGCEHVKLHYKAK